VTGQANLEREEASATMIFSEAAQPSGEVQVDYGSRDSVLLALCDS